tara:strand:- start:5425 stop:5694 length:270 start_codon:yes stop_codon:yes gene_type:complete
MKPYTDIESKDNFTIREFGDDIDPIHLLWHRDNEERIIEVIGETDWKLQLDNCLPSPIEGCIFIAKHEWHRVIKGTGKLKIKINKNGRF